jgi:hypothetical protein
MADAQWLFRHGDLILGPVPANAIIEKIYSGELDGKAEVQEMGSGQFRSLAQVEVFRVHLAKADAKRRVDAQAAQHASASKKKAMIGVAIGGGVLLVIAIVVMVAGSYLAVHTPGKSSEELAYGDLISVEAPTITRAKRTATDEELVDFPGQLGNNKRPTTPSNPNAVANRPNVPKNPNQKTNTETDEDGMQTSKVDLTAINAVVKSHQKSLFPCLAAVNKPGVMQKIPIEFTIAATGKVSNVWVDNPDYKEGQLKECLLKELQQWPFKPGVESTNVSLSFNIGKKNG